MARTRRLVVLLVALGVTLAACGGGSGSDHDARAARVTSTTTTTTTLPSTPTTTAPSSTTRPTTARPSGVPSPQARCIADTPPEMAGYLGRSLHDAETLAASQDYHVRVVGADGACKMVTQEYDSRRVDLYLDRGIVTAAGTG
jgi:hypothetical protein